MNLIATPLLTSRPSILTLHRHGNRAAASRSPRSHRSSSTDFIFARPRRPPLWEPDEGRYAEIAREMYLSRDYVTPRDDFVRYFEKPPLVYWCETAAISIFGANEFAIRLPAALFSAAQVVVTAALAEVMFGAAVSILAALALALSPLFFGFARFATLDPALAFFMTAALAHFIWPRATGISATAQDAAGS